jgi:hypothetical protein
VADESVRLLNGLQRRAGVAHLPARLLPAPLAQAPRPLAPVGRRRQGGVVRVLEQVREVGLAGLARLPVSFFELFVQPSDRQFEPSVLFS